MKLVKLADLNSKSVTSTELIPSFLYGENLPQLFIPGNTYKAGDHVYIVDSQNKPHIYICNTTGTYESITKAHFSEDSIEETFKQVLMQLDIPYKREPIFSDIFQNVQTILSIIRKDTFIIDDNGNISIKVYTKQKVTPNYDINVNYDCVFDVYIQNLRYTSYVTYFCQTASEIFINFSADSNIMEKIPSVSEITIYLRYRNSGNDQLLQTRNIYPNFVKYNGLQFGSRPEYNTLDNIISCESPNNISDRTNYINLYINGKYISDENYTYEDTEYGDRLITLNNEFVYQNADIIIRKFSDIEIEYVYSISKFLEIEKGEVTLPLDIYSTAYLPYKNYLQIVDGMYSIYHNGENVPYTQFVRNDHRFIDQKNSFLEADTITIRYCFFKLIDYIDAGYHDVIKYKKETVGMTYRYDCPIPFPDFEKNRDNILVMNNGILINPNSYVIQNSCIHSVGVCRKKNEVEPYENEYNYLSFDFHMICRDDSIRMISYNNTILKDEETTFIELIPELVNSSKFVLFFKKNGSYISRNNWEYDEDTNRVIFSKDIADQLNSYIIVLYMVVIKPYYYTYCKMRSSLLKDNNTFSFNFNNYNESVDDIFVFSSLGFLLDRDKIKIDKNALTGIYYGDTILPSESSVDILLIKKTEKVYANFKK